MAAQFCFDATDVMEFVAHMTDGPEPAGEVAEEWLVEHYDRLSDHLDAAFKDYVRTHWGAAESAYVCAYHRDSPSWGDCSEDRPCSSTQEVE